MRKIAVVTFGLALLLPARPAAAQAGDPCLAQKSFPTWLNCRVDVALAAAAGAGGDEKQAAPPSLASNSTSLLDTSSAPDFIGLGLTMAGIRKDGDSGDDNTASGLSASAYSLIVAAKGGRMFDPVLYRKYADWRRFSFTLGRQPAEGDGTGLNEKAMLFGTKAVLLNLRELSRTENQSGLRAALAKATQAFAGLDGLVQDLLCKRWNATQPKPKDCASASFGEEELSEANYAATLRSLPADVWPEVDRIIRTKLEPQIALNNEIGGLIAKIKRRPQLSLAWTGKFRSETGPNEHRFAAIFDYGIAERLSTTVNGTLDVVEGKGTTIPSSKTARAAGTLALKLGTPDPANLDEPTSIGVAGDAARDNGNWIYSIQLKVDVSVAPGVRLPISFTRASRADLIDEKDIRGLIGFTFDLSQIAASLRR